MVMLVTMVIMFGNDGDYEYYSGIPIDEYGSDICCNYVHNGHIDCDNVEDDNN